MVIKQLKKMNSSIVKKNWRLFAIQSLQNSTRALVVCLEVMLCVAALFVSILIWFGMQCGISYSVEIV